MPIKQDMAALGDALEGGLRELLGELIDGSIRDLDGPIREGAKRMALAAKKKRPDLVDEVKDQLALLVIEKQLRLRVDAGNVFEGILGLGINALVNGAIGGLGSLKAV